MSAKPLLSFTAPGLADGGYLFLALGIAVLVFVLLMRSHAMAKKTRRTDARSRPFPDEWRRILSRRLNAYAGMPEDLKSQLHGHINVFLDEKRFEGCGGLEITDEVRVSIAAQACLLLLNRETDYYPKLETVLVYPNTYFVKNVPNRDGFVEEESARAGEAWADGPLVVSWGDFIRGTESPSLKGNVITHEFAHRLDFEDGIPDGTPILENRSNYANWAGVLGREFKILKKKTEEWKATALDKYGATDPAEFFAVVTESFFENPLRLKGEHPELYAEFENFYGVDPASWFQSTETPAGNNLQMKEEADRAMKPPAQDAPRRGRNRKKGKGRAGN